MHDQPNVAIDADRPEVLVLRPVELVEAHPRTGRVQLQVERRRLDGLLLVAGESSETARERVGDAEFDEVRSGPLYFSNFGMARFMKSSKSGTVNANSPCAGL